MAQANLKGKFYGSAMRSVITVVILSLLLAVVSQVTILKNQTFDINDTLVNGVDAAKVLLSLIIVGVLLNFAYVCETLFPRIVERRFKHVGLIISSALHIAVIFIAYSYLVHFATDDMGNVN